MTNSKEALRKKAEEIAKIKFANKSEHYNSLPTLEANKLIHELMVHQIELDMQNDELRKTSEALEASHSRYFELYDLAPVGYVTVTENGLILEANLTAATLWGVDKYVLKDEPFTKYISSDSQDVYYMFRKKLFATKTPQTSELQMLKNDGTRFWAKLEGSFFLDSVINEPACRIVISDINELKEHEIRYRSIFEGASDGIIYTNIEDHTIHYVNPAFLEMFGYSETDIIGKEITEIHPKDCLPHVISEFKALKVEKRKIVENIPCARKDGTVFFADIALKQISFGNTIYNVGFFRDITLRKKAEKEKEETRAQLVQASKLSSLGTLAAGIGHEINNPLAIVMGNLEFVKIKCKNICKCNCTENLEQAYTGCERISAIVKGLHNVAKTDNYDNEIIDVHKAINNTIEFVTTIFSKDNVTIEIDFKCTDPLITGNLGKLQQVIMNVLINAKEAIKDTYNSGIIRISTSNLENSVCIKISDNGVGMDENQREQVFDIFYTTKGPREGTGLGLSISHSIIASLKGTIKVESEKAIGTTFIISIPRYSGDKFI